MHIHAPAGSGWRPRWCAVLGLLAGFLLATPAAAQQGGPVAVVDRLHETLLEVMRNAEALGFEGRRDRLQPVIEDVFNLPEITRIVLGRHWRGLDEARRAELIEVFTRLTVATYASRFDGYDGQRFEVVSTRSVDEDDTLVRTVIKDPDGDATQLDYVLHAEQNHWQIMNVIADGVSDLSLKRADYTSIMRKQGFETLITKLKRQIVDYANNPET